MKLVFAGVLAAAAVAAPALTHGQLVARADAICVRYESLLTAPPGVDAQLGDPAYDRAWLRLFARQRGELGALRPPAGDRAAWTRFVRTLPVVRERFRALTTAIEAGLPVRRWRPLAARLRAAERDAGRAARAVGLRRCFRRSTGPAG
jgi:hypothetical protein